MRNICIIGPGRAGGALAIALSRSGSGVPALVARSPERARPIAEVIDPSPEIYGPEELGDVEADIFLIAVNDDSIAGIAEKLARSADVAGKTVLHLSGSRGASVLSPLKDAGASTGGLHPLVSISDPFVASGRFEGVFFCVEGDPRAVAEATAIVDSLGGEAFEIPSAKKPLYHASAVVACGHLVALVDTAIDGLVECGLPRDEARKVLLPLIQSTVKNLETQAPPEALTGTFARADAGTFEAHLESMADSALAELRKLYLLLGLRSLDLAEQHGADPLAAAKIRRRIGELLE